MSESKADVLIRCDPEPAQNMRELCAYLREHIADKVCWIIAYVNDGEPAIRVDYQQVPVRLATDIFYTLYNRGKAAGGFGELAKGPRNDEIFSAGCRALWMARHYAK